MVSGRGTGVMKCTSFSMTWYRSFRPFEALLSTFLCLFLACSRMRVSQSKLQQTRRSKTGIRKDGSCLMQQRPWQRCTPINKTFCVGR